MAFGEISNLTNRVREAFHGEGLRAKVLSGSFWSSSAFGIQKIIQFASNLILTRILAPEMFGIMVLVHVVIFAVEQFSDIGVHPAVVRSKRGNDPEFLATAWTVQVIRGVVLMVAACVIAWPYAVFYEQEILFLLICACSVSSVFRGSTSIHLVTFNRDLRLKRILVMDVVCHAIGATSTIVLALILESVWALAIGSTLGSAIRLIASYLMFPPGPHRFRLERAALQELLSFGVWITLATLFTFMGNRGLSAVHGIYVDLEILGLISIGGTIAWVLGELVDKILTQVGYPALSRVARDEPDRMTEVVRRIRRPVLIVSIPSFVVLCLLGQPIIEFLYDPRYAQAGVFLSIAALNGAIRILPMFFQKAMLAEGNSRGHFHMMGLSAALRVGCACGGFILGGPIYMLAADGIALVLVYIATLIVTRQRNYTDFLLDVPCFTAIGLTYYWLLSSL